MILTALRLFLLAVLVSGFAPPPVALATLKDALVADAAALAPAALAFDRTTTAVRKGGGSTTNTLRTERWDGRRWRLLALNGKIPTSSQQAEAARLAASLPVPGYHRLAQLVAAATETVIDAEGRTVLKVPVLPKNAVRTDSSDISGHLQAELFIARTGGKPWVERVRVSQRESFRMNLLIKVLAFEQTSEYRLAADGTPRLVSQSAVSSGTMFGFPGGETSQVSYSYSYR